jgi:hypothetical protein
VSTWAARRSSLSPTKVDKGELESMRKKLDQEKHESQIILTTNPFFESHVLANQVGVGPLDLLIRTSQISI